VTQGEGEGLSAATLRRAKSALGVRVLKAATGAGDWQLPSLASSSSQQQQQEPEKPEQPEKLEKLEKLEHHEEYQGGPSVAPQERSTKQANQVNHVSQVDQVSQVLTAKSATESPALQVGSICPGCQRPAALRLLVVGLLGCPYCQAEFSTLAQARNGTGGAP